jgi:hypothetical protein
MHLEVRPLQRHEGKSVKTPQRVDWLNKVVPPKFPLSAIKLIYFQKDMLCSIWWWQKLKSTVYFAGVRARSPGNSKQNKILRLFDAAGFPEAIKKGDLTAIKIHFGEQGNDSYVNPVLVRPIADKVREIGAQPFFHRHQYPLRRQSLQCCPPPPDGRRAWILPDGCRSPCNNR